LIISHNLADNVDIIRRHIADRLLDAFRDTPAILVNGARQTGKSTLVQTAELAGPSRQYLTFDDPGILAAAKRDPNGFVAGLKMPVTLDEVQHVPDILPVIKASIVSGNRGSFFYPCWILSSAASFLTLLLRSDRTLALLVRCRLAQAAARSQDEHQHRGQEQGDSRWPKQLHAHLRSHFRLPGRRGDENKKEQQ
jgi:hypothetical protein